MVVHAGSTACPKSLPAVGAQEPVFIPTAGHLWSECCLMVFYLPCLPGPKHQPSFGSSMLSAYISLDLKACCWFSAPTPCFLSHSNFLQHFSFWFCTSAEVAQSAKQGYEFCRGLLNISPQYPATHTTDIYAAKGRDSQDFNGNIL